MLFKFLFPWLGRLLALCVLVATFCLGLLLLSRIEKAKVVSAPRNPFERILSERDALRNEAKIVQLDYYIPSFKTIAVNMKDGRVDASVLQPYCDYYQRVQDVFPSNWAGNFMLGLCRADEGQRAEASALFLRALEENPGYLWSYFNLGVMALEDGDFVQAADRFQHVLAVSPEASLNSMLREKVFGDIVRELTPDKDFFIGRYLDAVDRSKVLLGIALRCGEESQGHRHPEFCSGIKIPLQIM